MELTAPGRLRALVPSWVTLAAVLTWLVALPAGVLLIRRTNLDPLTLEGAVAPLGYGIAAGLVIGLLALVVRSDVVTGVGAGLFSAWSGWAIAANLAGTPYGYGSMGGDAGRMTALATYFSTTWVPSDAADPTLPSEYPPLYPMLIGRVAVWSGREAWRLVGTSQVFFVSFALLAAFVLWRRLVPSPVALALSATVLIGLSEPSKGNEILALAVFIPWLLASFAPPIGTRPLNPIIAGGIGGVMVPLYPSFLISSLLGIGLMLVVGWRSSEKPRAYLIHSAIVVAITAALSWWYTWPLVVQYAGGNQQVVADLWKSGSVLDPSLTGNGSLLLFGLQTIGLVGVVVLWNRAVWARALGLLLAGSLVARAYMLLRFTFTGHHFLMLYIPYVLHYTAAAAGVLALWELWQVGGANLLVRLRSPQRLVGVVAVGAVVAVVGAQTWHAWLPQPAGGRNRQSGVSSTGPSHATFAHDEYLPDGTAPRYPALTMNPAYPANALISAIDGSLSNVAHSVVLSSDQRLFAFKAYRNYLPPDRTSSNAATRWDDRKLVVDSFARIQDPATLAKALSKTEFGEVDALVLNRQDDHYYTWRGVYFSATAFEGPLFSVTVVRAPRSSQQDKPAEYVVIIRKR